MLAFFPILETLLKSAFWYRPCFDFSFISSIVAKRFPSIGVFSFWEMEKLSGGLVHCILWLRHYNPSVRIIVLVSHTTYVMCVNFKHKWRDLQFKVESERQIFWETFHGNFIFIYSEFLPEICWEEIAEKIFFVFCFDVWHGARILALRLISQHSIY